MRKNSQISKMAERSRRQREKILRVAVRLFWQKSYLGTSIDDIAKGANINKATIYYYFESKSAILYEIIMEHIQEIYKDALPIANSSLSPEDKLACLINNNLKSQILHQGRAGLSHRDWRELPLKLKRSYIEQRRKYANIFEAIIKGIIDKNDFTGIDEKLATLFTLGLVNSLIHWYKPNGRCSAEEIESQIVTYIMHALSCYNQISADNVVSPDLLKLTI